MRIGNQKLIELSEYLPTRLSRSAISQDLGEIVLREYETQVAIEFPSPKTDWQWQLVSQGWVGYIPLTPELGLYLSPKVPLKNLFGMLEYAYRLKSLKFIDGLTSCSSLEEFYEQIANLLAKRVLDRGRKGYYCNYYSKNEQLPYICGRLDVQESSRRPWDINLKCRYEEFTSDIKDNQILAWTLHKILLTGMCTEKSLPNIRLAYRTVQGFASLKPFGPKACMERPYNRLNQDYIIMHSLCRFFLENSGPRYEIGDHTMIPFIVDMARLFEFFVAEWLKSHLPPEFTLKSQEVVSIDQKRAINFKIDLVLYDERNRTPLLVLDTKYKAPDSPSNNDIYQAVTYAVAKKCSLAVLIYPISLGTPIDVMIGNIRVKSLTFALDSVLDQAGNEFINDLLALQESLIPKVSNQTKLKFSTGRQWDENAFFQELNSRRGPIESEVAKMILEWAKDKLPRFWWGEGKINGSVFPILDHNGIEYYPIGIWTYGKVEIQFQRLKNRPPFDNESKRKELLDRLNNIPGINIPEDHIAYRPNISLSVFKEVTEFKQFLDILDWIVQEIKAF